MVSYKTKKYLDVQYDLESLLENRNKKNYNIELDQELLEECNDQKLENKRIEAQNNLIKLRLIVKLEQNQSLSEIEQKYYDLWKENSSTNKSMPKRRSRMLIKEVNEKD